jgi:dihydrofolate synthase / folylpolyglutamate synthase
MAVFTLERILAVLHRLNSPQHHLTRVIHVAGTNGKGSVCALLESALRHSGYRTGLTISPHLVTEQERIQLDGKPISLALWNATQLTVQRADPDNTLSYFERIIAMAFVVFAQHQPDWVILETGVGGRLDATNVVPQPILTVITTIGWDHTEWLGDTLALIATEKAGICKHGVPLVLGPHLPPEARTAIDAIVQSLHVPVHPASTRHVSIIQSDQYRDNTTGQAFTCPLTGHYQADNIATALTALDTLANLGHLPLHVPNWYQGFQHVNWPGRFQSFPSYRLILDGSHNTDGMTTLCQTLTSDIRPTQPMVLGLTLKQNRALDLLTPLLCHRPWRTVWVSAGDDGYHLPDTLQAYCQPQLPHTPCIAVTTPDRLLQGMQQYLRLHTDCWGLITGSLYTVGDLLPRLSSAVEYEHVHSD